MAIVGVAVVLLSAAATAAGELDLKPGMAASAAGAGAAIAGLAPMITQGLKRRSEERARQYQEQHAHEAELNTLVLYRGLVADADPQQLGVSRSSVAKEIAARSGQADPPYIPRNVDGRVIQELKRQTPFIVLVGPSKSGKSRSAFEALSTVLGAHTMVAPSRAELDTRSLRRIFELVAPHEWGEDPVVLWLEDLHFFLRARALDARLLKEWRDQRPHVLVLATVTESDYGELVAAASGDDGSDASQSLAKEIRAVLDEATTIPVQTLPSADELRRANHLYPGVDFSVGIGVALVSGPLLVERLQTGGERHPDGIAVTCAAIDWVRAGMSRPIREAELAELCRLYLRDLRPRQPISEQAFEDGLAWATASVIPHSSVSLLYAADERGESFLPFDYIVAYREGEGPEGRYQDRVPGSTWQWIVGSVSPTEAFAVGLAAYGKGDLAVATDAMRKAGDSDQDDAASAAMFNLGTLYFGLDRSDEAIAAYDEVLVRFSDSTVPDVQEQVAKSLRNKGFRLGSLNRSEEEVAAYDEVLVRFSDSTVPGIQEQVATSLFNKGVTLGSLNRSEEALAAYDEVLVRFSDSTVPGVQEQVATSLVNKGFRLGSLDRPEEALAAYDEVLVRFSDSTVPGVQEAVAAARQLLA